MKNSPIRLVLLITLIAIVPACGGGGNPNSDGPTNNPPGKLNPGLSGHILSVSKGWLWRMNLATGRFTKIPGTNWAEDDDYHNVAAFRLSPASYMGNEFILRVRNCLPNDTKTSCIVTLDGNAIKTNQFVLSGRIRGAAKMSRNREFVALTIQYGGSITNDTYLEIYDRSGNLISDERVGTTAVTLHFDWLPDGRLAYSSNAENGRSIYITSPYSAKVERELTLPSNVQGKIREVAASPDGKQLAIGLVAQSSIVSTDATPWAVNVDGTNLRQLVIDPHHDIKNTKINDPKWSPDGRWILVKYGASAVFGGNAGTLPYLFAVPSDGVKVPLSPYDDSIKTTAVQIYSYWHAAFYERPDSTIKIDRWPDMSYDWIP